MEIPGGRGGISDDQLHQFVRSDDHQATYGSRSRCIRVDELIQSADLTVLISDDGELYAHFLGFVDILDPADVFIAAVNPYRHHFHPPLRDLFFPTSRSSSFILPAT